MRGGALCSAHAGRNRRRVPPEIAGQLAPQPKELEIPTLEEEIALLVARRNRVDQLLLQRLEEPKCPTAEALRYLVVLSQVGRSLALMLVQRAATGSTAEIERFFETVAARARELGRETSNET
jgi:hypothetical protein